MSSTKRKECACKGIRTCLQCESLSNRSNSNQNIEVTFLKSSFLYYRSCGSHCAIQSLPVKLPNFTSTSLHFQTIYARTKYFEFSFFPRTVAAWNELSGDTLLAQNLAMFKQNIATIDHIMPWDY